MTDFHELYNRYGYAGDIFRFAPLLCGDAAEAEDTTAETFVRALTRKVLLVSATVKGYLLIIARNLHLESVRHRERFTELPPELLDSSPQLDLEQVVIHKTKAEALQAYLQTSSELNQAALLFRADRVAYDEIVQALNISLASAKAKVHRLRLKIAERRVNRKRIDI